MQGCVCGQAACAFKFFIFLHNLTCPPARGVEPAWLFLGCELWWLGYRDTEKEFYCVVSAGQTFNPSILSSQHNQEAEKEMHSLRALPRHKTTQRLMFMLWICCVIVVITKNRNCRCSHVSPWNSVDYLKLRKFRLIIHLLSQFPTKQE